MRCDVSCVYDKIVSMMSMSMMHVLKNCFYLKHFISTTYSAPCVVPILWIIMECHNIRLN